MVEVLDRMWGTGVGRRFVFQNSSRVNLGAGWERELFRHSLGL
jgi:hypothetical protein